jgi:hypothetical protein
MNIVRRVEHVEAVRVESGPPEPAGDAPTLELSDRRLAELIAAIHAGEPDPMGRRVSPRVRVQGLVKLVPMGAVSAEEARLVGVYDVSRNGIAIIDAEPIEAGRQFNLHIDRGSRRPIEMLCTVRHCRPLDGNFLIGTEYGVSALSGLAAYISNPPAPVAS